VFLPCGSSPGHFSGDPPSGRSGTKATGRDTHDGPRLMRGHVWVLTGPRSHTGTIKRFFSIALPRTVGARHEALAHAVLGPRTHVVRWSRAKRSYGWKQCLEVATIKAEPKSRGSDPLRSRA